jgi:Putative papain-like cysteine peptidase (DUF1796)
MKQVIKSKLNWINAQIKTRGFEHVSLGSWCSPVVYLKQNNLRLHAYPFDWIHLSPVTVLTLLQSEFADFLIKDNLVVIRDIQEVTGSGHLFVYDKHHKIFFPHDFYSIDQDFTTVYEKYQRRIKRFLDLLKAQKKIKFVWQSYDDDNPLKELELRSDLDFHNMDAVYPQIYQHICEVYGYSDVDVLISTSNEWGQLK